MVGMLFHVALDVLVEVIWLQYILGWFLLNSLYLYPINKVELFSTFLLQFCLYCNRCIQIARILDRCMREDRDRERQLAGCFCILCLPHSATCLSASSVFHSYALWARALHKRKQSIVTTKQTGLLSSNFGWHTSLFWLRLLMMFLIPPRQIPG
jgi:hypothetical protein